ncbi:MAG: hypothetical protein U5L11_03030 [Arhodomonas sp.]|nr:hypothetical protein [Arhodomonas sp.]
MRLLYVQEDIADKLLTMLRGAMAELSRRRPLVGSPPTSAR